MWPVARASLIIERLDATPDDLMLFSRLHQPTSNVTTMYKPRIPEDEVPWISLHQLSCAKFSIVSFVKLDPVVVVMLVVCIDLPDKFLLRVCAIDVRLGDDLQTSNVTIYREQWDHTLHGLPSPLVEWILVNVEILHDRPPNLLGLGIHFPGAPSDERIEPC